MNKFGWSYPPGITRLPWDGVQLICEVCLGDPESSHPDHRCICPECEICGSQGDPACYGQGRHTNHGLQVKAEHRPLIQARRRLAGIHEQDRLADLHLAQKEQTQQQEWQLQQRRHSN